MKFIFFYFYDQTILNLACKSGNIELVKHLLSLDEIDADNKNGNDLIYDAIYSRNLKLVKYLISRQDIGINIESCQI